MYFARHDAGGGVCRWSGQRGVRRCIEKSLCLLNGCQCISVFSCASSAGEAIGPLSHFSRKPSSEHPQRRRQNPSAHPQRSVLSSSDLFWGLFVGYCLHYFDNSFGEWPHSTVAQLPESRLSCRAGGLAVERVKQRMCLEQSSR